MGAAAGRCIYMYATRAIKITRLRESSRAVYIYVGIGSRASFGNCLLRAGKQRKWMWVRGEALRELAIWESRVLY